MLVEKSILSINQFRCVIFIDGTTGVYPSIPINVGCSTDHFYRLAMKLPFQFFFCMTTKTRVRLFRRPWNGRIPL